MTFLTILPFRDSNTYIPSKCYIDYSCVNCLSEQFEADFEGDEAVSFYDSEGKLVVIMTYTARHPEKFDKSEYFVEEILVNVCGQRKLSDIIKELCNYVMDKDDSFGNFNFNCHPEDALSLLLQEFCQSYSYGVNDNMMYFSYEA